MTRAFTIGMTPEERATHKPGRGIPVPVGQRTRRHLNLSVTMADRWPSIGSRQPKSPGYIAPRRPPYAGYDPREKPWGGA